MKTLTNSAHFGATLAEAEQHLRNLEPFHTGTLSASVEGLGRDVPVYVVRSYGVLIAVWQGTAEEANDAFIEDDAYGWSRTTSKHANLVRKAWGL